MEVQKQWGKKNRFATAHLLSLRGFFFFFSHLLLEFSSKNAVHLFILQGIKNTIKRKTNKQKHSIQT